MEEMRLMRKELTDDRALFARLRSLMFTLILIGSHWNILN